MRKWIIAALTAALVAVGLFAPLATNTASATTCPPLGLPCFGAVLHHYAPDDGYDPAIMIRCNYQQGVTEFLYEGQSSERYCGIDMDEIYIRAGEEMWCLDHWVWAKRFDATGWHKVVDTWSDGGQGCTLRKD